MQLNNDTALKTSTNLDEHVHLCAQGHDLQRHCSNLFFVRFSDIIGETEAIDLLIGVTIQKEDSAASLRKNTRSLYFLLIVQDHELLQVFSLQCMIQQLNCYK